MPIDFCVNPSYICASTKGVIMAISKKKINKAKNSKLYIKEQREQMLAKCGYTALKQKHGKSKGVEFPDYKVESRYQLSNNVPSNGTKIKSGAHHPDAKQFPVYEGHKSNPVLLTSFDGTQYAGGKKPT
mgnify:CR=1 FL=1